MADEIKQLQEAIESGTRVVSLNGMTSISAKAYVFAELIKNAPRPFLIVADSNDDVEKWAADLAFWAKEANIVALPSFETDPYAGISPHAETQERRALALWSLSQQAADAVIVSARSLLMRTPSPQETAALGLIIRRDEDLALEDLMEKLFAVGYVREDPVNGVGQFSIRGGIVDIWPPDSDSPLRFEFFGDTVDSIRSFDPETQLSTEQLKEVSVAPMREYAASAADLRDWAYIAAETFMDERAARNLKDRTDFADAGEPFSGWEFLLPLTKPLSGSVFEHVGESTLVIDEPVVIEQHIGSLLELAADRYAAVMESGDIGLEPTALLLSPEELRAKLADYERVELRSLGRTAAEIDERFAVSGSSSSDAEPLFLFTALENSREVDLTSRSTQKFHGDVSAFIRSLGQRPQYRIVMQTAGLAERFEEIVRDLGSEFPAQNVSVGDISGGFELPQIGLSVYTESDIFGEAVREDGIKTVAVKKRTKARLGAFISDFRDLKKGDYVVHVDHGIGRFEGLQSIASPDGDREFMLLIYADEAKLFVPVERMDLVSRYGSGETTSPTVDRLGGIGWQKTKARAKRAMRDMADELLKLYAERKLVAGFAYSADTPWQHEFEDSFPYDLTADQASAIIDVKGDMETPRPMDRLIIGDVGYGKTEVAMRAAFKAVMEGKQVAVLTPTTILAYQHSENFAKRFAAFPVSVELLSRFRSTKDQKAVVARAAKGDVDVLIGTHRVLSADVDLPKLGLVIIDEEQRFGVAHKEKLKQLKKKVDVLTLSATPIPRTLNMSLLGMRDMSVIETPPRDRLAINTHVVQFGENVIRSAVELELARNGQVFFIHNRVETIETIAAHIKRIVPQARIAIGHGQMNEKEMEQVMLDFIDHKYDILVATTIIENGIDIPRANTIIINRADNYGLSQLYQLRGRVGRSNRRAYAYMLIPAEVELTPIARRRLSAIREFSDLGAGFRIAALDLELRGAGNILGGQQSGHLDALGFDLYTKMLERTIGELRGDEVADEVNVSINLGVDLSIPKNYIQDTSQRLRTYKRISAADSDGELGDIRQEIRDRYGALPTAVEDLLSYSRLRRFAERAGVISVDRAAGGFSVKLGPDSRVDPDRLMEFVGDGGNAAFSPNGILRVTGVEGGLIDAAALVIEKIAAS